MRCPRSARGTPAAERAYPIFSAVQISLNKWDGIGPKTFVGFDNYVELFSNPELYAQLKNALTHSVTIFALICAFSDGGN